MYDTMEWNYFYVYWSRQLCPHAAQGLLRESGGAVQGPPGPPGPPGTPGYSQWFSAQDNVVDVVAYLKCESTDVPRAPPPSNFDEK